MKQAFQEPGASVERTLTKEGKLWKTVQQWLDAYLNPPANVNVPDGERRTRQQIADMIDFDDPAFGIGLDTSNGPTLSVRLKAKGNLGWISL
jgi:hypothetical protein